MAMHAKSGGNIEVMGVMQASVALLPSCCFASQRMQVHACCDHWRAVQLACASPPHDSAGQGRAAARLQGKIADGEFIVIDAFALPVEGTETRVNAGAEAYEYMVDFLATNQVGSVGPRVARLPACLRGWRLLPALRMSPLASNTRHFCL